MNEFYNSNNDNADRPKGVNDILEEQIETAIHEYKRSNKRLFVSAVSAGLEIGFSIFLMGVLFTLFDGTVSDEILHVLISLAYPIGFIFVIIGRSELFTEHTTLAILPVLNKNISIKSLFILWGIILLGNLIGGYIIGAILTYFAPEIGIISNEAFTHLAHKVLDIPLQMILISAVIAGWLMGLLSWLVASSQETISRLFMIILVTATIGIGGLHHSIVGSIEVFSGLLIDPNIGITDYLCFEAVSILGNAIGGVFFVGIIKYGQRRAL
ncbi:MAG: formate/nitrite transporter FocA (FNT family) [Sediminicola sp.]|jgi:formate/nitrite transporter FocA (FNT family)|tara:strand:+ start:1648 stop:2454 length:807 start_codon:yes stop_codon:yes gene_type:complete